MRRRPPVGARSLAPMPSIDAQAATCVSSTESALLAAAGVPCGSKVRVGTLCNVRDQQPSAVLREHLRHPYRLVDAESDKTAVQQVLSPVSRLFGGLLESDRSSGPRFSNSRV